MTTLTTKDILSLEDHQANMETWRAYSRAREQGDSWHHLLNLMIRGKTLPNIRKAFTPLSEAKSKKVNRSRDDGFRTALSGVGNALATKILSKPENQNIIPLIIYRQRETTHTNARGQEYTNQEIYKDDQYKFKINEELLGILREMYSALQTYVI